MLATARVSGRIMPEKNIISDKIQLRHKNSNAYRQSQFKDLLVSDLKLRGYFEGYPLSKGLQDNEVQILSTRFRYLGTKNF